MEKKNKVFIANSIDGFIADKNGGIDWLHAIPNPEGVDMGYGSFMSQIDALVMGRTTFETVCAFDMEWPYEKPVYVLSNTLTSLPEKFDNKVFLIKGTLQEILAEIHANGYYNLYIDGGRTIQNFLKEDLIDEMTITTIPILLGAGIPMFSDLPSSLAFKCIESKIFLDQVVQSHFIRK